MSITKKRLAIYIVAGIVATLAIGGVIFNAANQSANSPEKLLSLGEKYLIELKYEEALAQFLKVIEIEPMNERAYLAAAEAYIGLGQTDKAIEILEKGLLVLPDSTAIKAKMEELKRPKSKSGEELESDFRSTTEEIPVIIGPTSEDDPEVESGGELVDVSSEESTETSEDSTISQADIDFDAEIEANLAWFLTPLLVEETYVFEYNNATFYATSVRGPDEYIIPLDSAVIYTGEPYYYPRTRVLVYDSHGLHVQSDEKEIENKYPNLIKTIINWMHDNGLEVKPGDLEGIYYHIEIVPQQNGIDFLMIASSIM